MLRKALVITVVVALSVFGLSGCKKRSSEPKPEQKAAETTNKYEADAKKEINKENMDEELAKIEKSVEKEISEEK
jgi:hypothetical protein